MFRIELCNICCRCYYFYISCCKHAAGVALLHTLIVKCNTRYIQIFTTFIILYGQLDNQREETPLFHRDHHIADCNTGTSQNKGHCSIRFILILMMSLSHSDRIATSIPGDQLPESRETERGNCWNVTLGILWHRILVFHVCYLLGCD